MTNSLDDSIASIPEDLRANVSACWGSLPASTQTLLTSNNLVKQFSRVAACSEFVATHISQNHADFETLITQNLLQQSYDDKIFRSALSDAIAQIDEDEVTLMALLRRIRNLEQVIIAWRDLNNQADLQETIAHESAFADAIIDITLKTLDKWQQKKFGSTKSARGKERSMLVVGVGKLGSQELNFSSDVDLIFTYPVDGRTSGEQSITFEQYYTRLAQRLIKVLQTPLKEGFVFRVDMRLRPYGDSGPLVMSFKALSSYYQEQGRDWERYALLKSRIVSGKAAQASRLLNLLKPFVYRRYVDYGSIQSLRDMKTMIRREVNTRQLQNDIKRGPGGIREIEFIGQVFQLIRGGKDRRLQQRKILPVLRYLHESGTLERQTVDTLTEAYKYLRNVEHRLQMVNDRQTHCLPELDVEKTRLAFAMNVANWEDFLTTLEQHRAHVESHFDQMLLHHEHEELQFGEFCLDDLTKFWQQEINQEQSLKILNAMQYDAENAYLLLEEFRTSHRVRRLESAAKERLDNLLPLVLQLVSQYPAPNDTLKRIIRLLDAIIRRSAYIVLLLENPKCLKQLIKLMAQSPWIAEHLISHPFLLEELLNLQTSKVSSSVVDLENEIRQNLISIPDQDLEQQMDALREFKLRQLLRTGISDIFENLPLMKVSDSLTFTASIILKEVQRLVAKDLMNSFIYKNPEAEQIIEPEFAIIAYGKLGGIELSYSSDLDLVFLHDNSSAEYPFIMRMAQRVIHVLQTRTTQGVLYTVDTRLRPSGSSGLLVSSIDAFVEYQQLAAWTWEHQALVRARVISGPTHMVERFNDMRNEILARKRDIQKLADDVVSMRKKMHESNKASNRYIIDIEFIAQFFVLAYAHEYPELLRWTDNIRIFEAAADVGIITTEQARLLIESYTKLRAIVHQSVLFSAPIETIDESLSHYHAHIDNMWQKHLASHATSS